MYTTNSPEVINGAYQNETVTAYDVPKPKKKPNLTEDDLFQSDIFSFGQKIGPLTNISTSIYALLPLFSPDSPEYAQLISRLKQCCVNQSKQIDKTKIGQDVKCIPSVWNQFQRPQTDPSTGEVLSTPEELAEIEFNNSILADRKPYFFKYNYKSLNKEYNDFKKNVNENLAMQFGDSVTIDSLIQKAQLSAQGLDDPLTSEEQEALDYYNKHLPVLDTDCEMNRICHYIESVDFNIKQKIRSNENFDYTLLTSPNFTFNQSLYSQIKELVITRIKSWQTKTVLSKKENHFKSFTLKQEDKQNDWEKSLKIEVLRNDLLAICNNVESLANHLVYLFYVEKPSLNKSNLWSIAGEWIFENVKKRKMNDANSYSIDFPVKDPNGSLHYLYENYQVKNIQIEDRAMLEDPRGERLCIKEEEENLPDG